MCIRDRYTEKAGTYVNFEGRVQQTRAAISAPGDARDDWKIVRAVSEVAGAPLPFDDVTAVQQRMADVSPTFAAAAPPVARTVWLNGEYSKTLKGSVSAAPLESPIKVRDRPPASATEGSMITEHQYTLHQRRENTDSTVVPNCLPQTEHPVLRGNPPATPTHF